MANKYSISRGMRVWDSKMKLIEPKSLIKEFDNDSDTTLLIDFEMTDDIALELGNFKEVSKLDGFFDSFHPVRAEEVHKEDTEVTGQIVFEFDTSLTISIPFSFQISLVEKYFSRSLTNEELDELFEQFFQMWLNGRRTPRKKMEEYGQFLKDLGYYKNLAKEKE